MENKKRNLIKRIIGEIKKTFNLRYGLSENQVNIELGEKTPTAGSLIINPDIFVISIRGEIPSTLRDYNFSAWDEDRYAYGPYAVIKTIKDTFDFFGFTTLEDYKIVSPDFPYQINKSPYIGLVTSKDVNNWKRYSVSDDGEIVPNPFFIYTDNGAVISKKTGVTYPLIGVNLDTDNIYHLSHVENTDWWDSLSDEDKDEIESVFG